MNRDMEEQDEILELYELSYSNLIQLSSMSSPVELEKLQRIRRDVMETLGPSGPGLLCITGVPNASVLCRRLLPLARKLTLLSPEKRKLVLKEHNLGSDVPLKNPDRNVSSFAMQLKYGESFEVTERQCHDSHEVDDCFNFDKDNSKNDRTTDFQDDEFKSLQSSFKELGFCMIELGLLIARVSDNEIGGHELERSLLESCTAKGRLIHYHSCADNRILREAGKTKRYYRRMTKRVVDQKLPDIEQNLSKGTSVVNGEEMGHDIQFNLWQQWHYDYGIFTILTDPMFLSSALPDCLSSASSDHECVSPALHSYLQICHPSKNKVFMVKTPPGSFIVQVGESADILSKGKLRSTLHCVRRPTTLENLSRETFVVFLQPSWGQVFSISDYPMKHLKLGSQATPSCGPEHHRCRSDRSELAQEIQKIVPPLSSRLKDGMTFADFSRETTKQYYGGRGLQSNR